MRRVWSLRSLAAEVIDGPCTGAERILKHRAIELGPCHRRVNAIIALL